MGGYPVFDKVDLDALQRFKNEFNIATDEGALDLILKLQSIFDFAESSSKSYWDNADEMSLLKEVKPKMDVFCVSLSLKVS